MADDCDNYWPTDSGWTDDNGNKIIPSGTTIESVLNMLFNKEIWYEPTIQYEWDSEITKEPSVNISTANTGNISDSTFEVGTYVYFNGAYANVSDTNYVVSSSGCVNGYKKFDSGEHEEGDYLMEYTCVKDGDYNLSAFVYGFKANTGGTETYYISSPDANSPIQPNVSPMYLSDGDNYIIVSQNGLTYNPVEPEDFESFVLYAASNMGNYSNDYSYDVNYLSYDGLSVTASGQTKSSTINGYRKFFYGLLDNLVDVNAITSNIIRGLNGSSGAANNQQWEMEIVAGKAQVIIAVPKSQFNSMEVFQSSINDSIQDVPRAKWKEINVAGANGYKPIPYVVWTYSTASGSFPSKDTYRITFKNV